AGGPERPVVFKPRIDGLEWSRIELVKAVPSLSPFFHQVCLPQQSQVLRYGWAGDRESACNLARRAASSPQKVQHGAAGGIGECLERRFGRICNRSVTHNA